MKFSYKGTKTKVETAMETAENKKKSSEPTLADISAATTRIISILDDEEGEDDAIWKKPEKRKVTLYEKKRKQEFKMVKRNRPHFTDEQAWMVVNAVDGCNSLQAENEADKDVLTSETDSG